MEARKSAIHHVKVATEDVLKDNGAVQYINQVTHYASHPLRLKIRSEGTAAASVCTMPSRLWMAAAALEKMQRDQAAKEHALAEKEAAAVARAHKAEENKKRKARC